MIGFEKVEGVRFFTNVVGKLNTIFANERTLSHLLENPHTLECPIGVSHERFTNVVPRESLLLEKNNPSTLASQNGGHGAPGRAASHDDYIVIFNLTVVGYRHFCSKNLSSNLHD
jgi:hypothetical protein